MDARFFNAWRAVQRHRDTLSAWLRQWPKRLRGSVARHMVLSVGLILALGMCGVAGSLPAHPTSSVPHAHLATTVTVKATASAKRSITPSATATAIGTPSEAQTPLRLSDPTSPDTGLTTGAPWWQSALDVTWKLALVVALILLAMRLLMALKQRGFAPKIRRVSNEKTEQRHFFEQIEEITLAPQHVLHAVRAGDRIVLIARTQGSLRALGEVELSEEVATAEAEATTSATSFAEHLFRWAGRGLQAEAEEPPPATAPPMPRGMPEPALAPQHEEAPPPLPDVAPDVIDARWIALPTPHMPPVSMPQATVTPEAPMQRIAPIAEPPLRRGIARDSEAPPPPEPMNASREREILWYAEEHNDTAAARKYGLTRQRVTAMRMRMERERVNRLLEEQRRERDARLADRPPASASPLPRRTTPATPLEADHPREDAANERHRPSPIPQGSAARAAYQQTTLPPAPPMGPPLTPAIKPDVAPATNAATGDAEPQAVTVGQILAARFGVKIPATK